MTSTDGAGGPWDHARAEKQHGRPRAGGRGYNRQIEADYNPDGKPLLPLAGWTAILTGLTLGIYRFWMITRLRRYYWRAIRVDGDALEYTGRGIEKFLGFLIAVVCLALYLGLVNLALTFAGLSFGSDLALNASLLSAVPLYFFAIYRARRYVMARTRWRGIRFGMENGAWPYTVRALLYGLATILSLGLLYPLMQFRLEKFKVDRTWFGDQKFEQKGSWVGLFARWLWLYGILALVGIAAWATAGSAQQESPASAAPLVPLLGVVAILIGFLVYRVAAFRYFWNNRTLGETGFRNDVSAPGVVGVYIGGMFLTGLCASLVIGVVWLLATIATGLLVAADPELIEGLRRGEVGPEFLAAVPGLLGLAAIYLGFLVSTYAFSQVFIVQPILRRKVEAMSVLNPAALGRSRQRAHDEATEAGGFADALGVDVGAGF